MSFVGRRGGDSFHSPDDQAREIRRWAAEKGVRVELLPADLDGKSNDWNRPILNDALEGVRTGRYAGVVVAKQDRLAREVPLMHDLLARVTKAGGHLAFADDDVDTTTPDGMMWFNIRASIDQRVRDQHAVDFDRQRQAATERGIWQRRQTPKGYDRSAETRKLVPNGEAGLVRQAFEARARGFPLVQIADLLRMTASGARYLLDNRVYLGELRVGKYVNPAAHAALVDVELYEAANNVRAPRAPRERREVALLAGLVRCGGCGHLMARARTKREIYGCHVRHSAGRCPAPAAITADSLDRHVAQIAVHHLQQLSARPVDDGQALVLARREMTAAEDELHRFLEGVLAAGIDPTDFADAARGRKERVEAARRNVSEIAVRQGPVGVADAGRLWAKLEVGERNHLLRGLVECVVIRPAGRGKLVPVADRVRVIAAGVDFGLPVGHVIPLVELDFPAADDPRVLRVAGGEDPLQGIG